MIDVGVWDLDVVIRDHDRGNADAWVLRSADHI